jgi:hypothetical protein
MTPCSWWIHNCSLQYRSSRLVRNVGTHPPGCTASQQAGCAAKALWTRVLKVLGSNLDRNTAYPEFHSWFFLTFSGQIPGNYFDCATTTRYQILSYSLSTNNPSIPRYIVRDIYRFIEWITKEHMASHPLRPELKNGVPHLCLQCTFSTSHAERHITQSTDIFTSVL